MIKADQWGAISSQNPLWTDLIQRTMPMDNLFTPMMIDSFPYRYTFPKSYGNPMCIQPSTSLFDAQIAQPENTGVEIAKGVGAGLYDAGKDFLTGI